MPPDEPLILEVAIPSPLYRSFDYRAPPGPTDIRSAVGMRVLVPFGRRQLVGVILATRRHTSVPGNKIKSALGVLDTEPVLDAELMELLSWAARYYQHPIGEVIAAGHAAAFRRG